MTAPADRAEHRQWPEFADRDLRAARALEAAADHSEAVVYWAQQAAEKALKALLVFEGAVVPRSHDLAVLRALSRAYADRGPDHDNLSRLTRQSIGSRYPDMYAPLDREDARRALDLAELVVTDIVTIIAEKEDS